MVLRKLGVIGWIAACLFFSGILSPAFAAKAPVINVELDRQVVSAGEKVNVTWSTKYTKYCFISHGVGLVKRKGTIELAPAKSTTYTITAYGTKWRASLTDEEKAQYETSTTFDVIVSGVKPQVSFAADTTSIYQGDSITLSWTVDNANDCSIDQGVGVVAKTGKVTLTPKETTEYTLTAVGPGGSLNSKVKVIVNERAE